VFDADRPIIYADQDRLNRAVFAKYLARCLLDHDDPDSLVVGLYGSWGAGKTSIINMVLEELNFAANNMLDDEKPIILNFSPWSYSGQHQLIYSFFRRLSSTLQSVPYFKNRDRIIYLLELYVSFFTHRKVPKALRPKRSFFEKLTSRKQEEEFGWESGRDLTLVKAELNELLRQEKHRIIIIIDNISRLYDDEIKQIFQIVKSMGDYAKTTYLLSFDKEYVISAINKIDGRGGTEFVEKIVQLPFEVPPILQQDLEIIFADRLKDIMKQVPDDTWNSDYWADVYYSSLKYFFENCRDITRYVNTLNFSYPRLRDVVNPVDFFALTVLEVFLPDVYFGVRENKDLFTDLLDHVYKMDDAQIKKDKLRCDEILSRGGARVPRDILLALFIRLFPRIRSIYEHDVMFYHSDAQARKYRRICSPDLFDAYFRLSMPLSPILGPEFETILSFANEPEAFDHALTRLNQDERITQFLDKFDDSKVIKSVAIEDIQAIVSALIDNGDLFAQGESGPLRLDTPMRIHRIIHGLLRRLETTDKRFLVLQNAIANATKSLHTMVYELREQSHEHIEERDSYLPLEYRDLTPEQLELLKKLVVTRIQDWANHGNLMDLPRLLPILYAWEEWGREEDTRRYVDEITKTDRGLLAFLEAVLDKAISEVLTRYEKNPAWEKYLKDIDNFIPAHTIEPHAKELFEDEYFEKLREREQLALMIFLDLIKTPTKKIIPKTTV
jgi:predicted KAP-like P-loop ATPase